MSNSKVQGRAFFWSMGDVTGVSNDVETVEAGGGDVGDGDRKMVLLDCMH